jgi:tRNA(adenine34) deaminase
MLTTEELRRHDGETRERLADLKLRIDALLPDPSKPADSFLIRALREAHKAGTHGNYGVGVISSCGARGRNRVFEPYFRSDRHAEMDIITRLEKRRRGDQRQHVGKTLYPSLPPCPMCTFRIVNAGFSEIHYAGSDPNADPASIIAGMPPIWRKFVESQNIVFKSADCSPVIHELGWEIFAATNWLDLRLAERGLAGAGH